MKTRTSHESAIRNAALITLVIGASARACGGDPFEYCAECGGNAGSVSNEPENTVGLGSGGSTTGTGPEDRLAGGGVPTEAGRSGSSGVGASTDPAATAGSDSEGDACGPGCGGADSVCESGIADCGPCGSQPCTGNTPVCDADSKRCVQCLTDQDCPDSETPQCTAGICTRCDDDGACVRFDGLTACSSGRCVECGASNETRCGTYSCDPNAHRCTQTARGSLEQCQPCVADSECAGYDDGPRMRCVPMRFQGQSLPGGYCLPRASAGCEKPYSQTLDAISLSGAEVDTYCSVDQGTTTCDAVVDAVAVNFCDVDSECGCQRHEFQCVQPGKGGACAIVTGQVKSCTLYCSHDQDCVGSLLCRGGVCVYP